MKIGEAIAAIAATGALKLVLKLCSSLELVPLSHWEWGSSTGSTIGYISSIGAAAIGSQVVAQSKTRRCWLLGIGVLGLLASWVSYNWMSVTPPTENTRWLTGTPGQALFFVVYLSFGWTVALVVKFFSGKK
jgi:hypothetical protein